MSDYLNAKLEQYKITQKEFTNRLPKGLVQVSKKWFSGESKPNKKSRFEINRVVKELFLLEIIKANQELKVEHDEMLQMLLKYYIDAEELDVKNLESRHKSEVENLNKMMEEMINFNLPDLPDNVIQF